MHIYATGWAEECFLECWISCRPLYHDSMTLCTQVDGAGNTEKYKYRCLVTAPFKSSSAVNWILRKTPPEFLRARRPTMYKKLLSACTVCGLTREQFWMNPSRQTFVSSQWFSLCECFCLQQLQFPWISKSSRLGNQIFPVTKGHTESLAGSQLCNLLLLTQLNVYLQQGIRPCDK